MQSFYQAAAKQGGRLWLSGSQLGIGRMAEHLAENQHIFWPYSPVDANVNRIRIELIAWMKKNDFKRLEPPGKQIT